MSMSYRIIIVFGWTGFYSGIGIMPHTKSKQDMACPVACVLRCILHRRYRSYFWLFLIAIYILAIYLKKPKTAIPELEYVVVHIDLKGAPPRMQYLVSLLKVFHHYGANGLLIEYEDMFPFEGNLQELRSKHAYNKQELTDFLKAAAKEGFTIIPLVQTFGHLEYLLKHKKWEDLKENRSFNDSICPSRPGSVAVIGEMLQQIIEFHENVASIPYIHIGCDEVHHLNECSTCCKQNQTKLQIFKKHVGQVVNVVHEIKPKLKVLIWDDMLRGTQQEYLQPLNLNVEPVSWHYSSTVNAKVTDLHKYNLNFKSIWIASAFKGADGISRVFPDLSERFRNHYSWVQLLHRYSGLHYNFKGIILTGWSRYYHSAPLCELMVPSIPSIITNLLVIKMYKQDKYDNYFQSWQDFFTNNIKYDLVNNIACKLDDSFLIRDDLDCTYPGRKINSALTAYKYMDQDITAYISNFNNISKQFNFTLPIALYKNIITQGEVIKSKLDSLKQELWQALTEFYPDFVADEYVVQNTEQLKAKLNEVLIETYAYKKKYI